MSQDDEDRDVSRMDQETDSDDDMSNPNRRGGSSGSR